MSHRALYGAVGVVLILLFMRAESALGCLGACCLTVWGMSCLPNRRFSAGGPPKPGGRMRAA